MHDATRGKTEQQFIHLVRLAWDLWKIGRYTLMELSCQSEPVLAVMGVTGQGRIMAVLHGREWMFTWGRGRTCRVRADAEDAAERISAVIL